MFHFEFTVLVEPDWQVRLTLEGIAVRMFSVPTALTGPVARPNGDASAAFVATVLFLRGDAGMVVVAHVPPPSNLVLAAAMASSLIISRPS